MRWTVVIIHLWTSLLVCEVVSALPVKSALQQKRAPTSNLATDRAHNHSKRGKHEAPSWTEMHPMEVNPSPVMAAMNNDGSRIEELEDVHTYPFDYDSKGHPTSIMRVRVSWDGSSDVVQVVKSEEDGNIRKFRVLTAPPISESSWVSRVGPDGMGMGWRNLAGDAASLAPKEDEAREALSAFKASDRNSLARLVDAMRALHTHHMIGVKAEAVAEAARERAVRMQTEPESAMPFSYISWMQEYY